MGPVEVPRAGVAGRGLARVLVPVATPVAEAPVVVRVVHPVVGRAVSRERQPERPPEVLPRDEAAEAQEEAVVPVVLVDVVAPAGDRRVPASRVGRSVVNSTTWKLRPLAECGFLKGKAKLYDCHVGPR